MIHMMIGLQASGKTTYVEKHAPKDAVIVSPDRIRQEIFHVVYDPWVEEGVWSAFYQQIEDGLRKKKVIVIDNTNVTRSSRALIFRLAKKYDVPVIGYWFHVPIDECKRRNQERIRIVPDYMIDNMQRMYDEPKLEEGFKELKVIGLDMKEKKEVNNLSEKNLVKVRDTGKKRKRNQRKAR